MLISDMLQMLFGYGHYARRKSPTSFTSMNDAKIDFEKPNKMGFCHGHFLLILLQLCDRKF